MKHTLALLLAFSTLAPEASADFGIVYQDTNGKVVYAAMSGSQFVAPSGFSVVTGFPGDIPSRVCQDYAYENGQLVDKCDGKYFILTADDESLPTDNQSWTTLRVTLTDTQGDPVDDDSMEVEFITSKGVLSSTTATLLDGTATVTLRSTYEQTTADITVDSTFVHPREQGTVAVDFVP